MAKLLLVDDNATQRRLLYHALKDEHRVLEAEGADPALVLLSRQRVDLVVLDMHLAPHAATPEEGLRLHSAILDQGSPPPVVVVSSDADPGLVRRVIEAGVAGYLTKPVDTDLLRRTIRRALTARKSAGS